MDDIFRYRIITNLQCNKRCGFCYQTFKPEPGTDMVLSRDAMMATMGKVKSNRGMLDRATVMGGETLLLSEPWEYIRIAKEHATTVCLVTNGTRLNGDTIANLRDAGLDELAVSISSMKQFKDMLGMLKLAAKNIPNTRVNIPRCEESSYDKLKVIVDACLDNRLGCVVCEDLMGRYGEPHDVVMGRWEGYELLSNNHNFLTYMDTTRGKKVGLFAHYSGYNKTDVIITPVGNFSSWDKYCEKIGNHALR